MKTPQESLFLVNVKSPQAVETPKKYRTLKQKLIAIANSEISIDADTIDKMLNPYIQSLSEYKINNWEENRLRDLLVQTLHDEYPSLGVAKNYNVGGFLGLKIDIDINDGGYGLELKKVSSLTSTEIQRLIGQVIYYQRRTYTKDNLGVVLFGKVTSEKRQTIDEMIRMLNELKVSVFHIVDSYASNNYLYKHH